MKLKRLEIYGFKSFAQRTEIVFNDGITGIVGPNGSGKSNIGDAVRWVLGEQSAKQLRGDKMEDVIFSGTEKRKPMSYCEVTLVFDNQDKKLNSEYAEIQVTRRVYRNGESEYYLNKTACRLKDIVELFRDTGIGKEGYSIIGQGRIDEILSQKSEDRRLVFEEAAGIVKYKSRKDEAKRRLERTQENLDRVEDILSELQDRVAPLQAQAETARRYIELSARLKDLELNIFLIRHDKMKEKIAALEETLVHIAAVLEESTRNLAEKMQQREDLESVIAQTEANVTRAHEALLAANERWHMEQTEKEKMAQRLETEKETLIRLQEEQQALENNRTRLSALLSDSEGGIEQKDAALKSAREEQQALSEQVKQAQNAETVAEAALESHKNAMMEAVNRLSSVRNQQTRQTTMKAQMETRLSELAESSREMNTRRDEMQQDCLEAEKKLDEAKEGLLALQREADSLQGQSQDLGRMLSEKSASVQENYAQTQTVQSRLHTLEELAQDFQGYNNSVRQALTYAKNRGSDRVKGVVAMLMQVPQKYETAIDMVLGAALQNIVTADESAAKELIEYLRSNQYGRATFLPMNTVTGRTLNAQERKVLSMPGCLGVASELISYDSQYRAIMENLLGRTVIATDLNAGIPIMREGHHAFRLVTLQGDVMSPGGSMTGGSIHSKASSFLGREREIKELRTDLQNRKQQLLADRQALEQLDKQRQDVKRLLAEALGRVHQEEISVAREQEHLQNAQSALSQHEEQLLSVTQAVTQLKESLAQIDEDLKNISRQSGDVEMDREAMEKKTLALQEALNAARDNLEAVRDSATGKMLALSELTHALESLQRDSARMTGEMESAAKAVSENELRRQSCKNRIEEITQSLSHSEQSLTGLENGVADCRIQVEKAENTRAQKQNDLHDLQQRIEDVQQQSQEQNDKLHKAEVNKTRIEGDLKAMQERIWNSYELTYAGAEEFRTKDEFNLADAEQEAGNLKSEVRQMGNVNVGSIEEYTQTKERFDELYTQKEDLVKARDDLNLLIAKLLRQMESQFVEEFAKLQEFFQETFVRLFGGGQGELRLSDPNDALNCGIDIIVQPPGKKLQLLSLFSGGERALTAIAILFAMLKLKPTPFCILDEIEAALDEANVAYFADYLKEFGKNTQFIVVSHRKGTMERCDALYGVAMEEKGISRIVSVNLSDFDEHNGGGL